MPNPLTHLAVKLRGEAQRLGPRNHDAVSGAVLVLEAGGDVPAGEPQDVVAFVCVRMCVEGSVGSDLVVGLWRHVSR